MLDKIKNLFGFRNLGKPKYNILCIINEETGRYVPPDALEKSISQIKKEGLLGIHHVTDKGYFLDGKIKGLETKIGEMDIFYRKNIEKTIPEIAQEISRKANLGLIDEELSELAIISADILKDLDPISTAMPLNMYSEIPMIRSMSIDTEAGIQGAHYHCRDGSYIRLFKPKKEKFWFDFDIVKDYFFDISTCLTLDYLSGEKTDPKKIEHANNMFQKMMYKPDNIEKLY